MGVLLVYLRLVILLFGVERRVREQVPGARLVLFQPRPECEIQPRTLHPSQPSLRKRSRKSDEKFDKRTRRANLSVLFSANAAKRYAVHNTQSVTRVLAMTVPRQIAHCVSAGRVGFPSRAFDIKLIRATSFKPPLHALLLYEFTTPESSLCISHGTSWKSRR